MLRDALNDVPIYKTYVHHRDGRCAAADLGWRESRVGRRAAAGRESGTAGTRGGDREAKWTHRMMAHS